MHDGLLGWWWGKHVIIRPLSYLTPTNQSQS